MHLVSRVTLAFDFYVFNNTRFWDVVYSIKDSIVEENVSNLNPTYMFCPCPT